MNQIVKSEYVAWKEVTQSPDAGRIQVLETREAFYSGFFSCFSLLTEISETYSEESASKILSEVYEELTEFFKDVTEKHEKLS